MTLLTSQDYHKGHVSSTLVETSFKRDKDLDEFIQEGWELQCDKMLAQNHNFYDGPLVRFEGSEFSSSHLVVKLSKSIHYSDVVGLRARPFEQFQYLGEDYMPNAFSVMSVLVTADDKLPIGWRQTGDWEKAYEITGGFMRVDELSAVFDSSLKRLLEDYSITNEEVDQHSLLRLYSYPEISETTALFVIKTGLTSKDVQKKNHSYPELKFLDNSIEAIKAVKDLEWHGPSLNALEVYADCLPS